MAPCELWFLVTVWGITFATWKTQAMIIKGEVDTKENWVFLARFCFLSQSGNFQYFIEFPKEYMPQNILLYYDSSTQWPAVYKTNKSCLQKEAVLSRPHGQVVTLSTSFANNYRFYSGCLPYNNNTMVRCISERRFASHRERWWYISLSNCNSKQGLKLKYAFYMKNDAKSLWFQHFSADEFGILETDIAFSVFYWILFLASCICARLLRNRHLLHHTYKMFMVSVFFEFLSVVLRMSAYVIFALDGIGNNKLKLAGRIFDAISTVIFLLLLILVAKGYTVTRGRLRPMTSAKIGVFMTCYCVTYAALFIYEQMDLKIYNFAIGTFVIQWLFSLVTTFMVFDPGEVLYLYESLAGYGIIILRLVGWGWFIYATVFTLIHYPDKSAFYTRLFLTYTVWFLSGPVIILIATFIMGKWVREKIINGVELTFIWLAHTYFLILTRPSVHNKNFPYHVRTTQIDIMEMTNEGRIGDNHLDRFCGRAYAPSSAKLDRPPDYATLFGAHMTYNLQGFNMHPEYLTSGPQELTETRMLEQVDNNVDVIHLPR